MNSPVLSSILTALETKIFGEMMVVTSYFKDEVQSLKNIIMHLIDLCVTAQQSVTPLKNRNQRVALFFMKLDNITLFSQNFTPVSKNFIQVLNICSKH